MKWANILTGLGGGKEINKTLWGFFFITVKKYRMVYMLFFPRNFKVNEKPMLRDYMADTLVPSIVSGKNYVKVKKFWSSK